MNPTKKIAVFFGLAIIMSAGVILWNPDRAISDAGRQNFWTNKSHNEAKYDVVIAGDSRVYRGVSPDYVVEGTDLTAYNFGFSSGSMSRQMLDYAASHLDYSNHPVLIIGVTPYSLTQDAVKDEQFTQENGRSKLDVLKRKHLMGFMRTFDPIRPSDFWRGTENKDEFHSNGWMSNVGAVIDDQAGLDSYAKSLKENPIDQKTVDEFIEFVEEEVDNGARVYGFRPPTMKNMEDLENSMTGFLDFNIAKRFEEAGGFWLDFDNDDFITYDGSHLQKSSAIKLSQKLGEYLFD